MKNKYKKTELPITIITDDEHKTGDNLELTRQRIEKATLYIHSLFNSIRYSLENLPSFDDQKLEEVVWDARNVCELGYGVADSILASASCLTEFQPDDKCDESESAKVSEETNDAESPKSDIIARMLSVVLNSSELPRPIYLGFDKVMTDFFNSQLDRDEFQDDVYSPEYIARHLKIYGDENNE
jgi:hypothetical protein